VYLIALGVGEYVNSGEKMKFSPSTHIADVRLVVARWTYDPEHERMVNVQHGNPIFTNFLIALVFLVLKLF
jgi:hypothetical protein